jgi:aminopeptidase N
VGTALPTLSVHDDAGWHRVPFEDLGESFYSLVAEYDVTFVTPARLDVAATGVAVRSHTSTGRTRTRYTAERVRDFAWAAGRFRTVERRSGGVEVVISYQREHVRRSRARAAARSAVRSMNVFSAAFGPYPYPEVDVVLTGAGGPGGMEYPTIVFSVPHRLTMAHELAHQWFYGAVGNDQYHEPWLDESFASWSQRLPFGAAGGCDEIPWPSEQAALTNDMGYWSEHPAQYRLVYDAGACMLASLAHRFGRDRFLRILGRYVDRHRFGIARTPDFTAAIEAAAARHLPGFDAAAFWQEWRVGAP